MTAASIPLGRRNQSTPPAQPRQQRPSASRVHQKPAAAATATAGDWLATVALYTPLATTTLISKVTAPGMTPGFALAWPLILLVTLLGLLTRSFVLDPKRLAVYLAMAAVVSAAQVLVGDPIAPLSLLLAISIFFTYAVSIRPRAVDLPSAAHAQTRVLDFFGRFATFIAICGVVQFGLQFVAPKLFVFPIETLLPKSLLITGYNYIIPLKYGASIFKSNGIFMLEPSFFSQFLAIALIAELLGRNRLWRMGLYLFGMALSYSGTGLITLAVVLPVVVAMRKRWDLLLLGLLGLMALIPLAEPLHLNIFLERATEFDSVHTSGFQRFLGGAFLIDQFQRDDTLRMLFGMGAGTFMDYAGRADMPTAEMALYKIVFEYGVIGAALIFGFLIYCLARSRAPGPLRLAIGVTFLLSGIYTSASHGLALTLLIWPSSTAMARRRAPMPPRVINAADRADADGSSR